jgi:hypothetical protein
MCSSEHRTDRRSRDDAGGPLVLLGTAAACCRRAMVSTVRSGVEGGELGGLRCQMTCRARSVTRAGVESEDGGGGRTAVGAGERKSGECVWEGSG